MNLPHWSLHDANFNPMPRGNQGQRCDSSSLEVGRVLELGGIVPCTMHTAESLFFYSKDVGHRLGDPSTSWCPLLRWRESGSIDPMIITSAPTEEVSDCCTSSQEQYQVHVSFFQTKFSQQHTGGPNSLDHGKCCFSCCCFCSCSTSSFTLFPLISLNSSIKQ